MRNWRRWFGLETRDADATQTLIRLIQNQSSGQHVDTDPNVTAAVEVAARVYAHGLAAAKVMPESAQRIITPSVLGSVGRSLIRKGESIFVIDTRRGRIDLSEAVSWDVQGGPSPSTWTFKVDLPGPSTQTRRMVRYPGLVHFRWSYDPVSPWQGVAPLQSAASTGRLMAAVEGHLADESETPRGYILPLPIGPEDDEDEDGLEAMKAAMLKLKGKLGFVETTAGGYGDRSTAPPQDWVSRRIGAAPSKELCGLREAVYKSVLSICGVPMAMLGDRSDGTARREAYRFFHASSLSPLARILEQEVREKLEIADFRLDFTELMAADIQGRARSYKSLIGAGMEKDLAAQIVGFKINAQAAA